MEILHPSSASSYTQCGVVMLSHLCHCLAIILNLLISKNGNLVYISYFIANMTQYQLSLTNFSQFVVNYRWAMFFLICFSPQIFSYEIFAVNWIQIMVTCTYLVLSQIRNIESTRQRLPFQLKSQDTLHGTRLF